MIRILFMVSAILFAGCGDHPVGKKNSEKNKPDSGLASSAPQAMHKVWEAHGGLERWSGQRTLEFTIPGTAEGETHVIDLVSRKDRIDGPGYSLGFDGHRVWLVNSAEAFKGNPDFYHNLMFYFFAMPFVLSDPGIQYQPADSLQIEGITYPGLRIRFEAGVGTSPKDEYLLYYNPETFQMEWLGYTVTYFNQETSEDIHWIRYGKWQETAGLLLPEVITWYAREGEKPTVPENTVSFKEVSLAPDSLPATFFDQPEQTGPSQ